MKGLAVVEDRVIGEDGVWQEETEPKLMLRMKDE